MGFPSPPPLAQPTRMRRARSSLPDRLPGEGGRGAERRRASGAGCPRGVPGARWEGEALGKNNHRHVWPWQWGATGQGTPAAVWPGRCPWQLWRGLRRGVPGP